MENIPSPRPVIDPEALERLRRLGGDELLRKVIDAWLAYVPERVRSARNGLEGEQLRTVERAAHSIKSSAGTVGALEVHNLASRIEELASGNRGDNLSSLLCDLETACLEVTRLLEQERQELQS
ncbi:MAG: Hpt domain-containing protein [Acidobacteriota bacterium]